MRIAPEGYPFIAVAWAILLVLAAGGWWIGALIWLPVAVWVVAFFRDPQREGPRGDEFLIAPADGKVVSVLHSIDEPDFHGQSVARVAIFMNVFNVHVNRYPASGTVTYRHDNPGRFFNAASEKASLENEQNSIGLETPRGKILVRQIAGLVARRIVTDDAEGARVTQGQRMGLIRFGSRVDLFIPQSAKILVSVGDRTKAGETVVATWT
ncbi:MAG: phosphatidylserine decarboxylase family protein [Gemmatimonadetes bacterium]|nr:MAG: phosphatidylserine decarboxylase family protein [Gemmatimonadota bacterium]